MTLSLKVIEDTSPDSVVSYNDNRWGNGSVYKQLGFDNRDCTLGYYYIDYKSRFNRLQFQKHKLVESDAAPDKTEIEIMRERGFDRIWDCGQSLWVWENTNKYNIKRDTLLS